MYEGIRSWVSLEPVYGTGGVYVMYEGIRSWVSLEPVSRTGGLCNVRGY